MAQHNRVGTWQEAAIGLFAVVALVRCGDELSGEFGRGTGSGGDGATAASTGGGSDGPAEPPEMELEESFRVPVVTGRFVWSANPESGRVALIDASNLDVRTLAAGLAPTFLTAVPTPGDADRNVALVINALGNDATLFDVGDGGDVASERIALHAGANAWAVSASGRYAAAWTATPASSAADPADGFQDVTVVDLAGAPIATRLSVGYRPSRLVFDEDETRLFAITRPEITVIALDAEDGPRVVRGVDIEAGADPSTPPDVGITPDGRFAIRALFGRKSVELIDIEGGRRVEVPVGGDVTDVDLDADGARAIAVIRGGIAAEPGGSGGGEGEGGAPGALAGAGGAPNGQGGAAGGAEGEGGAAGEGGATEVGGGGAPGNGAGGEAGSADGGGVEGGATGPEPPGASPSRVVVLPIPGAFDAPNEFDAIDIEGELFGLAAVAPESPFVLLYSNAITSDRLTILNLDDRRHRTVTLNAPVRAVLPTLDGDHAVAVLAPPAGSSRLGAFSLVPVSEPLPPKLQGTDAPVDSVAIMPDSSGFALITTRLDTESIFETFLVRLDKLGVDSFDLASAPLATGMVPAVGAGYVAQEHPEGRITFIDLDAGRAKTLTGFELGEKVVDGN